MEKHKCKLCSRRFSSGRALGGHMRSHLATLPIPPKTPQHSDRTDPVSSSSSSSSSEEEEEGEEQRSEGEEKALAYGLRENPKRSFRLADPEFSFAVDAGSVVQDRESETESRNPTRRRSKRAWKLGVPNQGLDLKKPKLGKSETTESPTEPEPVSSVSNTWPEEDIAMCLVMLSRDTWTRSDEDQDIKDEEERSVDETCKKVFSSFEASPVEKVVNKASKKKIKACFEDESNPENGALGGHKRSHLLNNSTTTTAAAAAAASANSEKFQNGVIDLNLPAPPEDYAFSQHSAVSYAEFIANTIKC
ncbi:Zinc finger protein ZAT4 [Vitis vinifera]|uniref:Zinc finger protein ZAT4 n=1 Tax=Vitis vinifera TaxID=29760 RepID=A0A438ESC4_VITVI|nr:Zinc finger protein ZAT4 [Vitis vinifera]